MLSEFVQSHFMTTKLFGLGGILWLVIPFIMFVLVALRRAFSGVNTLGEVNLQTSFRLYAVASACSCI